MKTLVILTVILGTFTIADAAEPLVLNLWPGTPPGDTQTLPPEADTTDARGRLVAGKRVIRLGNVSTPQLAVYFAPKDIRNGAAVIICPGGGFNILAYDLEGTEVAAWLNSIGVTAIVLKYRVPFRDPEKRWLAATQDAQRAMSLVRSKAADWNIDPARIGILGFSAGGAAAALTSFDFDRRHYSEVDDIDRISTRPDFALLIYTGGSTFYDSERMRLREDINLPATMPPLFFVHAFDDNVPVQVPLLLAAEARKVGGSAEVHVYDAGGHGYGLRHVPEFPVTTWPKRAEEWLSRRGLLKKP